MKILVIIPAFNEEGSIGQLVAEVREHIKGSHILVINDSSTDRTGEVLKSLDGVKFLTLPFNMGIGGAVLAGFNYFLANDYDVVIRMDGDGQHPPDQAGILIDSIISGGADEVIGSRYLGDKKEYSSRMRMMGINLLNTLSSMILRKKVTDSTSGFRAYNRKAIEYLVSDYPVDYPEPEEIYILTRKGYEVRELPVRMKARETGTSSINTLKTYYFLVRVLLTIFVKYMIGGKK
jgi:hypothetical protein